MKRPTDDVRADPSPDTGQIVGLAALARAVGRSKSTAHSWAHHPDWRWSRAGPWNAGDVPDMRSWAAETLRPNEDADGGYFDLRPRYDPLPDLLGDDGIVTLPVAQLPDAIVSKFEHDIIAGRRALTPSEAAGVVELFATFRAYAASACKTLPGWLAGHPESEIAARMRSEILLRCEWASEALADIDAQDQRRRHHGASRGQYSRPIKRNRSNGREKRGECHARGK